MATNQERLDWRRDYAGPEFLKEGFRPLCMAAGIWATMGEGLVMILHVGYLWLAVRLILLGVSMLQDAMTTAAALHMLTLGAMGTMTLAVMTRAILGHMGCDLHAGPGTMAIFTFVIVAMALRVVYAFAPTVDLIWASAGF